MTCLCQKKPQKNLVLLAGFVGKIFFMKDQCQKKTLVTFVIFKDEGEIRLTGVGLGLEAVRECDNFWGRINE